MCEGIVERSHGPFGDVGSFSVSPIRLNQSANLEKNSAEKHVVMSKRGGMKIHVSYLK